MTEDGYPREVHALMAQFEVREAERQARVARAVEEIKGNAGTSLNYGEVIQQWIDLTNERNNGGLPPTAAINLRLAESTMRLAFGEVGIVHVLQAWFSPEAMERRAAAAATSSSESQQQTVE